MSPLPELFVDRWQNRPDSPDHDEGLVYWHVLLGQQEQVRSAAQVGQTRLAGFPGLHMTPLEWLHMTVLVAGSARDISKDDRAEMLSCARSVLSSRSPIGIRFGRVFYHQEAIVLEAESAEALDPIREAAISATRSVISPTGQIEQNPGSWKPHVTLCYSTLRQAANPIISALGKNLPGFEIRVENLSLVVQRGPERLWDWERVGDVHLSGERPE